MAVAIPVVVSCDVDTELPRGQDEQGSFRAKLDATAQFQGITFLIYFIYLNSQYPTHLLQQ